MVIKVSELLKERIILGIKANKKKIMDEKINKVLSALSDEIGRENVELYRKLTDKIDLSKIKTADDFYYAFHYPHKQFLEGLIQEEISSSANVAFLIMHHDFLEKHFGFWIKKIEGACCYADKTSTILYALLCFFKEDKKIEFNYGQDYTYNLPKKIFKNQEDILNFYTGLMKLLHGNPNLYLLQVQKLIELHNEQVPSSL